VNVRTFSKRLAESFMESIADIIPSFRQSRLKEKEFVSLNVKFPEKRRTVLPSQLSDGQTGGLTEQNRSSGGRVGIAVS
jgi:hypothetical protein